MTLYHYVRNKDELLTLMDDAIMGELLVPDDELADGWRAALTQIADRTRDVLSRHPWTFDRLGDGRPGPNGMRHFEQSLRAVAGLEISDYARVRADQPGRRLRLRLLTARGAGVRGARARLAPGDDGLLPANPRRRRVPADPRVPRRRRRHGDHEDHRAHERGQGASSVGSIDCSTGSNGGSTRTSSKHEVP